MSQNSNLNDLPIRQRLPFMLRLVLISFLALSIIGAYRFITVLGEKSVLAVTSLPGWLPIYFAVSGLIWAIVCLLACVALWLRTHWATKAAWMAVIIYLSSFWAERLWIWQDAANARTWLFYALLSLVWIGLCLVAFRLPASRHYLDKDNRGV